MNEDEIRELNQKHDQAMEYAGLGLLARHRGDEGEAMKLFRQAFELEREVAHQIADMDIEPRRSVLHRSAATLAVDCGEIREAEKLVAVALAGEPPPQIARELRDILLQILPQLQEQAVG